MRQIGLALMQYTQDNDEAFPTSNLGRTGNAPNGYAGRLYIYIKSADVFACPNDKTKVDSGYARISYASNQNLAMSFTSPMTPAPDLITQVITPTATVFAFEVVGFEAVVSSATEINSPCANGGQCAAGRYTPFGSSQTGSLRSYATGPIGGRTAMATADSQGGAASLTTGVHSDGANYLACDGHVKWLKGLMVSGGATPSKIAGCAQDACIGSGAYDNAATSDQRQWAMTFSPL